MISRAIFGLTFLCIGCSASARAIEAQGASDLAVGLYVLDRQCESGILSKSASSKAQDVCLAAELIDPAAEAALRRLAERLSAPSSAPAKGAP